MYVENMELCGFRNYPRAEIGFTPGINVILGNNAQGKTNMLEAIYYLTCAKSFRTRFDRELIGFDRDFATIKTLINTDGHRQKIEARLIRGQRKQLFAGGARLKTAAELSGILRAVLFCPEDLQLIQEGAAGRRRFLDQAICQLRPAYVSALQSFHRAYEQKTRILRDFRQKPDLLDTLDEFSYRMAAAGAQLIYYRAYFSQKLSDYASRIHFAFSGQQENLSISYQTVSSIENPLKKPSQLMPALLSHIKSHRQAEIDAGLCLSGAHKDDLVVEIGGKSAKSFASQGQTRTAALSMKLAERDIHIEDSGYCPILLLDDVLSELDPARQNFVLNRIGGGQVFITCCEMGHLQRVSGQVFHVENGSITKKGA